MVRAGAESLGLTLPALRMLRGCLPAPRVLSLGYPDIVAKRSDVRDLFGVDVESVNDSGLWHSVKFELPETGEFFEKIGSKLDCVDIVASRGVERIVDLNYPEDLGQYDLVIDGGTIEHCFMAGQAILNAAGAVKPGGRIMHGTPMSMVNHGFWNVCPTLYYDFYTQNGWEIEAWIGVNREGSTWSIPETKRVVIPDEISLLCVARRLDDSPLRYPTQTKYLANPMLKI